MINYCGAKFTYRKFYYKGMKHFMQKCGEDMHFHKHKDWTFFDVMCGTCAVSGVMLKENFNIRCNDFLLPAYVQASALYEIDLAHGFEKLCDAIGIKFATNPSIFIDRENAVLEYLEKSYQEVHGFFYINYRIEEGNNQGFFHWKTASSIDYYRSMIQFWDDEGLLTTPEKNRLLATVIACMEKLHKKSNSWLNAFQRRKKSKNYYTYSGNILHLYSLRKQKYRRFNSLTLNGRNCCTNLDAEHITSDDYDKTILFLDPPSRADVSDNRYGNIYGPLVTFCKNDNPILVGKQKYRIDRGTGYISHYETSSFAQKENAIFTTLNNIQSKYVFITFKEKDPFFQHNDHQILRDLERIAVNFEVKYDHTSSDKKFEKKKKKYPWLENDPRNQGVVLICIQR